MNKLLILISFINFGLQAQYYEVLNKLHEKGKFNGTAMVIKNGEIVYQGAFGPANKDSTKELDINSAFRLCSVSKQFTAMGILILMEKGKLKLTDSLRKYIPECPYPNVNIKQLLTHTSGLPDYMPVTNKTYEAEKEWWDYNRLVPNKDSVINMLFTARPEPAFKPGEGIEYSNTAYALLAIIIERISKQSFTDFMKENIFDPLEMHNTQVLAYIPGDTTTIKNRAYGYWVKNKKTIHEAEHHYLNCMQGEGGIYSNAPDLAKWDKALYTEKLVSKETLQEAFKGHVDFKPKDDLKYGYGWGIREVNGQTTITEHSGGWVGFRTFIWRNIQRKDCIILLTNNSGKSKIGAVLKEFKILLKE